MDQVKIGYGKFSGRNAKIKTEKKLMFSVQSVLNRNSLRMVSQTKEYIEVGKN